MANFGFFTATVLIFCITPGRCRLKIKLKRFNIVLAVVSIAFIGMILLYGIMKTAAENALKKHDVTMAKPQ